VPHFEYVVGAVLVVVGLTYGKAVFRVLGFRLRTDVCGERVQPSDVRDDVRKLLEAESRSVEALGFAPSAFLRTPSCFDGVERPTWARPFQHPRELSFALLEMRGTSRLFPCEVVFHAQADEGRRVETQGWPIAEQHSGCAKHVIVDAQTLSLGEQWERHQREVAARPDFAPRDISADELLVELRGSYKCMIGGGIERGAFARWRRSGAVHARNAIVTVVAPTKRGPAAPRRSRSTSRRSRHGEVAPAAGVRGERRHRRGLGAPAARRRRAQPALGLGHEARHVRGERRRGGDRVRPEASPRRWRSCSACCSSTSRLHALAMKAFGYRNLQILFILSSARSRRAASATFPRGRRSRCCCGPAAGIVAGSALLSRFAGPVAAAARPGLVDADRELREPAADHAARRRAHAERRPVRPVPNLQLGFAGLSGVALLALGSVFDDTVVRVLGIAMLVGVPAQ
jgi:hypothetical protein